jgi:hypothetical protein
MGLEYVIYADESEKSGRYFSNFYGGCLVRSVDHARVREALARAKADAGIGAEAKWGKVTARYLPRYEALMATFFDLVAADRVKVRVMFTQRTYVPTNLSWEQKENAYFLLYYQFIKHAFGLRYANPTGRQIRCRLYLDRLPDTREKVARFKSFLCGLSRSPEFRRARIVIPQDQIAEVRSHDHVVLQCLDIVLGAMQFRLNDKHKAKPRGARTRGRKTIAKEKLYKAIGRHIRRIYPNFNIGISTGIRGDPRNRWFHPYRHWLFIPADHAVDSSRAKP